MEKQEKMTDSLKTDCLKSVGYTKESALLGRQPIVL